MTCTFLVFCVPSAPKVFTNLLRSLKSLSIMSVKQAENPSATSWPRPAQAETGTRRMYRMINESGENGVTLGQYPSTNNRRLDTETNPDEGIVCTTHIAIHEDYIGPNPENGSFSLQHPWTVNVR